MSRASRLLVGAILVAAGVVACGPQPAAAPTASPPASQSAIPAGPPPVSPVVGIVTSVDSAGLNKVKGFMLRDQGGRQFGFVIGQLENGDQFPPGHLAEHQITAEPVEVWFRAENGQLVVYRLADAPTASSSPSA